LISLANLQQIYKDYFLLFYTISSFFEQAFVRCLLLFNKTWKEMRACDNDFQVVSSVVFQQISQSLDEISLNNSLSTTVTINRTILSSYSPSINQITFSPMAKSNMNTSLTSVTLQKFTFDYFSERLNINNYKDVCRRRDEEELKREEIIMKLPIVEYDYPLIENNRKGFFWFSRTVKERLRSHVESLTRQARLNAMKRGHQFITIESQVGTKKGKSNYPYSIKQ
jgi:hypothetical protein